MESLNIFIPTEEDFKKWISQAVREGFIEFFKEKKHSSQEEPLLSRTEIARILDISLVTLTDWVK